MTKIPWIYSSKFTCQIYVIYETISYTVTEIFIDIFYPISFKILKEKVLKCILKDFLYLKCFIVISRKFSKIVLKYFTFDIIFIIIKELAINPCFIECQFALTLLHSLNCCLLIVFKHFNTSYGVFFIYHSKFKSKWPRKLHLIFYSTPL